MKYIFVLLLCLAFFGGSAPAANAQTSGDGPTIGRSDSDELVAFYEWALEATFTPAQRSRFRYFLEKDIRENGETARRGMNNILDTWAKIRQSSEEVRRRTRAEYLRGFLPELKRSRDEDAAFLLDIYRAAHGGRDTFTDLDEARFNVADKGDLNAASTGSPGESLIGKWQRSTGQGSIGDGTGKTKYGSGTTFTFAFSADGVIDYTVDKRTLSIMGCKIEKTDRAKGGYALDGGSMTMKLGPMTSVGTDSCDRAGNYKKHLPASDVTVTWRVKRSESPLRPDNPVLLCFDGDGGEACYEKIAN